MDDLAAQPPVIFGGLLVGTALGMTLGTFVSMQNDNSAHIST
jgi:hypothetical protein